MKTRLEVPLFKTVKTNNTIPQLQCIVIYKLIIQVNIILELTLHYDGIRAKLMQCNIFSSQKAPAERSTAHGCVACTTIHVNLMS